MSGTHSARHFVNPFGFITMLVVAHLATRVELTYRLASDGPPTLVAVFDDDAAAAHFCERHRAACAWPAFHRLSLQALLGHTAPGCTRQHVVAESRAPSSLCRGGPPRRHQLQQRHFAPPERPT